LLSHCALASDDRGLWVPAFAGTTQEFKGAVSRSRGAMHPRFARKFSRPGNSEGAGKTGCALHPRSRVHKKVEVAHTSIQVQRKHSGLPCAMALRLITCSPRRSGFVCHRRPADIAGLRPVGPASPPRNLTPTQRLSGPHAFAVRNYASRLRAARSLTGLSPTRPATNLRARRSRVHRSPAHVS
jgi:hypothetical protein